MKTQKQLVGTAKHKTNTQINITQTYKNHKHPQATKQNRNANERTTEAHTEHQYQHKTNKQQILEHTFKIRQSQKGGKTKRKS